LSVERSSGDGPFEMRVARGARAVEAALLAEIAELAEAGVRNPRLLRHPVRVVVPSASLRLHVAAALMRVSGRALAGVTVQTLHALALEIVEPCGTAANRGEALFPILVRQCAREEPALRDCLDELLDGYVLVAEDVADLLDAGFTPDHSEALVDSLGEISHFPELVARAGATVRVAERSVASMEGLAVGHRARLLERARNLLERDPERALPARAIFVHGFAEATGLRAELLEALVRQRGARVYFDEPPDPANLNEADTRWRFSRRLHDRLAGVAGVAAVAAAQPPPAKLTALKAPGAGAEMRAVAARIRELLDAGHLPESVAVVARDLASYRTAARRHFRRLGIPFSGVAEIGSVGTTQRRAQALLDLLQRRGRVSADRWLDALVRLHPGEGPGDRSDLRLGLRHMGAVRLTDVADLAADTRDIPLPAVGSWRGEDADDGGRDAGRRVLRRAALARAIDGAGRAQRALTSLQAETGLGPLLQQLRVLLVDDLGWDPAAAECAPVFALLDGFATDLPPGFALHYDDFLLLLRHGLKRVGSEPIGGAGGGVQILSVMEARARTFEALFLVGLNRDVFPRSIRSDPLLPDLVRRAMSAALPDLPIKATGYDEERYLFAQLLSASPRVTLSWQVSTDDSRECAPSTLVERLAWGAEVFDRVAVPSLHAPLGEGPQTVDESALRAGLFADRGEFAEVLPLAFDELNRALPEPARCEQPAAVAAARLALLDEFDPPRPREGDLGPYFGFAGVLGDAGDPRRAALYVTTVEQLARCPWQTFLSKLLRIEAPPDPLAVLPGSDPLLLGSLVHRTLEQIVRAAVPAAADSLAEARTRPAVAVAWPDRRDVEARLRAEARSILEEEGIRLRGLERVLVDQARPLIESARALDWSGKSGSVNVLGVELEGRVVPRQAGGEARELRFRADRVDAADGDVVLTDYKTGRPVSGAVKPETRARHLLEGVGRGRYLQPVAYALAVEGATGRYLFLDPDLDPAAAVYSVRPDDAELVDTFEWVLETLLCAWDAGAFPPRLLDDKLEKENPDCERCELAAACLRGDSGARRRVAQWLESAAGADVSALAGDERSLRAIWHLGAKQGSTRAPGGRA
jgi:RecB family exonuclease